MNIFKVLWTFCQIASLGAAELWKCTMKDESHSWGQAGPGQKRKSIPSILAERDIPESPKPQLGDMLSWYESIAGGPAIFRKPVWSSSLHGWWCCRHPGPVFVHLPREHLTSATGPLHLLCPFHRNVFLHNLSWLVLLTVCFSVQMPNAQRGHLQRSAVKKPDTLCCQHFYQVDFIHSLYYSCLVSMFNSCLWNDWMESSPHPCNLEIFSDCRFKLFHFKHED